jgi:hypothetical protein
VHDRLGDLESINKLYRRLAKEGRTDTKGVLRSRMQEANDRWDNLQHRVTAMMQVWLEQGSKYFKSRVPEVPLVVKV